MHYDTLHLFPCCTWDIFFGKGSMPVLAAVDILTSITSFLKCSNLPGDDRLCHLIWQHG